MNIPIDTYRIHPDLAPGEFTIPWAAAENGWTVDQTEKIIKRKLQRRTLSRRMVMLRNEVSGRKYLTGVYQDNVPVLQREFEQAARMEPANV
jgi:hypothetical protein